MVVTEILSIVNGTAPGHLVAKLTGERNLYYRIQQEKETDTFLTEKCSQKMRERIRTVAKCG